MLFKNQEERVSHLEVCFNSISPSLTCSCLVHLKIYGRLDEEEFGDRYVHILNFELGFHTTAHIRVLNHNVWALSFVEEVK